MATTWTTLVGFPLGVAELASAVTAGATGAGALPLKTGMGTQFAGVTWPVIVTLDLEKIICAAIVGDALTVTTRGAYGTTARAHLAGARVSANLETLHITEIRAAVNALENKTQKLGSDGNFASGVTVAGQLKATTSSYPTLITYRAAKFGAYNEMHMQNANDVETTYCVWGAIPTATTAGAESGAFVIRLKNAGSSVYDPDPEKLRLSSVGDLTILNHGVFGGNLTGQGGTVTAGVAATTRGILSARSGSGGAAPGCNALYSKNGTAYYFWVTDAGVLRRHTSLPTADTDGVAV